MIRVCARISNGAARNSLNLSFLSLSLNPLCVAWMLDCVCVRFPCFRMRHKDYKMCGLVSSRLVSPSRFSLLSLFFALSLPLLLPFHHFYISCVAVAAAGLVPPCFGGKDGTDTQAVSQRLRQRVRRMLFLPLPALAAPAREQASERTRKSSAQPVSHLAILDQDLCLAQLLKAL